MLKLYHGHSSVCSAKVRVGLFENGLEWESCPIDLKAGQQFDPDYLKLNRNGVVPTLVDDGHLVVESSLILAYIDELEGAAGLMPENNIERHEARLWLLRGLDIHAAVNTLTYVCVNRPLALKTKSPEQIAASIARIPNAQAAAKRTDIFKNGLDSRHLPIGMHTLKNTFENMADILSRSEWVTGTSFGMSDVALIAYIDRIDRLGMADLWSDRFSVIGEWLERFKTRQSYDDAIEAYNSPEKSEQMREIASQSWSEIKRRWEALS